MPSTTRGFHPASTSTNLVGTLFQAPFELNCGRLNMHMLASSLIAADLPNHIFCRQCSPFIGEPSRGRLIDPIKAMPCHLTLTTTLPFERPVSMYARASFVAWKGKT